MNLELRELLILGGAFAGTLVTVFAVYRLLTYRQRLVAERMAAVRLVQSGSDVAREVARSARRRSAIAALDSWLGRSGIARKLERRLTTAGIALKPAEFAVTVVATTVSGALVGALGMRNLLAATLLGGLGYYLPNVLVGWLEARRRSLLEKQLATAVRLISASMQAGHGFQSSLGAAAQRLPPPLADELQRVVARVNRGLGVEQALREMTDRVNSYDFDLFVNAVAIQLRGGGRLSEILDNIAATIRQRLGLQREVRSATAQGKLSGAVLFLVPLGIAAALMVINRQYAMLLFTSELGRMLVRAAVLMQVIGFFVIKRLLRIRV
ncbi:MAG: hypothetical protein COY42_29870 [Armatimonadetes bacterium CG_4_10_14_0_8_um_filter_66_14]|nr:MAG: hypothetical protein COY42_29870 [Armatimonadetes bacterium CG_4_10_14_0_8_um_filter_66_14]